MEIDFEPEQKLFVLIDWPLIVRNVSKAITMLGGLDNVSDACRSPQEWLSMNLTPDSLVMRGTFLTRTRCTRCLVLRIRRKKGPTPVITQVSCIGRVDTVFKARSMVDFQYLPMARRNDGSYQGIHEHLTFREVRDWTSINRPDVDLYMIPASFSRVQLPVGSFFQTSENTSGSATRRMRQKSNAAFVEFDLQSPLPQAPPCTFPLDSQRNISLWNKVSEQLEIRPIWTRTALAGTVNEPANVIRDIINNLAYFYISGPWSRCWVRFGYDPRLDVSSKQYQVVDYRASFSSIRHQRAVKARYNPKIARVKNSQCSRINRSRIQENSYVFRKDLPPGARNIFYQLIDMDDPEIRSIWRQNDGKEPKRCHVTDGWCIQGYQNLCRAVIYHSHKMLFADDGLISEEGTKESSYRQQD